jgi:leader peptidase (prepilin peptidase) / N-methyltransferase
MGGHDRDGQRDERCDEDGEGADGFRVDPDVLGSPVQLGGGVGGVCCGAATAEEERRLGVPLIPGRVGARSFETHRVDAGPAAPARRLVTTAGALAVSVLVGATILGVAPFPAALTIALLVPAAVIDVEERRLPDVWVATALITLVVALTGASASGRDVEVIGPIAGALAMMLPLLALHLVSPAAMGFGDVKAAAVLGAALGSVDWRLAAVALCVAALLGSVTGLAGRRRSIAFGPHLVAASIVVLVVHEPILEWVFESGSIS